MFTNESNEYELAIYSLFEGRLWIKSNIKRIYINGDAIKKELNITCVRSEDKKYNYFINEIPISKSEIEKIDKTKLFWDIQLNKWELLTESPFIKVDTFHDKIMEYINSDVYEQIEMRVINLQKERLDRIFSSVSDNGKGILLKYILDNVKVNIDEIKTI